MKLQVLVCTNDLERQRLVEHGAVARGHAVTVTANGLEALDRLSLEPVDVLFMDLRLPVMGALEAVAIIRDNPDTANLRVAVFAEEGAEDVIRQLVAMRVTDILLTHKSHDALVNRIRAVFTAVEATAKVERGDRARVAGQPAVLIVDGDSDYAALVDEAIQPMARTTVARTGAKALEHCRRTPPDIVLIGDHLGMIGREALVRWLRPLQKGEMHLVAMAPKSQIDALRDRQVFDAAIVRAYTPAAVAAGFAELLGPITAKGRLTALVPNIRTSVLTATEQTFAMLLKTDIDVLAAPAPRTTPWIESTLSLRSATLEVGVHLGFDVASGRSLAATFLECDVAGVADDDALSAAGELVNVLAGRLAIVLRQRRPGWTATHPRTHLTPAGETFRTSTVPPELRLGFRALERSATFEITLTAASVVRERVFTTQKEEGVTMLRSTS